jgi:hypothetical protein
MTIRKKTTSTSKRYLSIFINHFLQRVFLVRRGRRRTPIYHVRSSVEPPPNVPDYWLGLPETLTKNPGMSRFLCTCAMPRLQRYATTTPFRRSTELLRPSRKVHS